MRVEEFDFYLPGELIAQTPLEDRTSSRLLQLNRETGEIRHGFFPEIVDLLKPGDTLVLNNTRVIPARLIGFKPETGAKVEILLLKQKEDDVWEALVKPAKRVKAGTYLEFYNLRWTYILLNRRPISPKVVSPFLYTGRWSSPSP